MISALRYSTYRANSKSEAIAFAGPSGDRRRSRGGRKTAAQRNPKRVPRDCYNEHAYGLAIMRACRKAEVDLWRPNQLRHSAGTSLRSKSGVEVARTILGHASMNTTEICAERVLEKVAMNTSIE
jgi:integrase